MGGGRDHGQQRPPACAQAGATRSGGERCGERLHNVLAHVAPRLHDACVVVIQQQPRPDRDARKAPSRGGGERARPLVVRSAPLNGDLYNAHHI